MRPVIVVSRDAINRNSPVVVIVPLTNAENIKRLYPNDVLIPTGVSGLAVDSVALTGQVRVISKKRLLRWRGMVSVDSMRAVERALRITLDL